MVSTLWALHVISVFYICAPFTDNFFQTCTLLLQWSQLFHFTSALLILDDLFLKANMPPNPWDLEATACGIHSALSDVTIWQWSLINHIQKVLVLKVLRKMYETVPYLLKFIYYSHMPTCHECHKGHQYWLSHPELDTAMLQGVLWLEPQIQWLTGSLL